jgi:hypothetical protein
MNLSKVEEYKSIPKIIWILWFQGEKNAPMVVSKCIESWKKYHPNWKVIIIDENTYSDYINISSIIKNNKEFITKTLLSDIVRVNLLNKYGGVWVDSTCYCNLELENWVDPYIKNSFFMFRPPVKHSPISSWFIIASKDSKIINILKEEVNSKFEKADFQNQNKYILINNIIERIIFKTHYKSKLFKSLFYLTKILKFYPYFYFHYIFGLTLNKNKIFKDEWEKVKYFSAVFLKILQRKLKKKLIVKIFHYIN